MNRIIYYNIAFLFLFTSLMVPNAFSQCEGRYLEPVFDSTIVTEVQFGANWNSSTQFQELYMDIYEPYGDTKTDRPIILLGHGGAFIDVIDHKSTDIVRMCEIFSKMGYVCGSFDYREEANIVSLAFPDRMIKAVFRGVQDGKAAIRYFKRSAAEGNPYRIDPDQIVFGGVSAGALLAVNLVYVTNENMLPWPWDIWLEQVGGLEGNTGNPGYDTDVLGIINISGAIGKASWMSGNDIPLLNIHGTEDPIVPYLAGRPLGVPTLPNIFGSGIIHEQAVERGIPSKLVKYEGFGHVPFFNLEGVFTEFDTSIAMEDLFVEEIWDSTIRQITDFAYALLECNPNSGTITAASEELEAELAVYPNPSAGQLNLQLPDTYANSTIEIYSTTGHLVSRVDMNGHSFETNLALPSGLYTILMTNESRPGWAVTKRWVVIR